MKISMDLSGLQVGPQNSRNNWVYKWFTIYYIA